MTILSRWMVGFAFMPAFVGIQGATAEAQTIVDQQPVAVISSGTVCPRCGKVHPQSQSSMPIASSVPSKFLPAPSEFAPVQAVTHLQSHAVSSGTSNVLTMLNAQRSRQGLGALRYDPTLQAVAQRRAQTMASMRLKSHPPGSFAPGRYEGVGWNSSFSPTGVSACYTSDPNMRAAGAAMVRGSDGMYFCVVYR